MISPNVKFNCFAFLNAFHYLSADSAIYFLNETTFSYDSTQDNSIFGQKRHRFPPKISPGFREFIFRIFFGGNFRGIFSGISRHFSGEFLHGVCSRRMKYSLSNSSI